MRLGFCLDLADLIRYRRQAMPINSNRPQTIKLYTRNFGRNLIRISLQWSELHKPISRLTNSLHHVFFQSRRWIFMPRIQPTRLCDASPGGPSLIRWPMRRTSWWTFFPWMSRWRWGDICNFSVGKGYIYKDKQGPVIFCRYIVPQKNPIFDSFFSCCTWVEGEFSPVPKAWTSRCEENNSSCRRVRMSRAPQDVCVIQGGLT